MIKSIWNGIKHAFQGLACFIALALGIGCFCLIGRASGWSGVLAFIGGLIFIGFSFLGFWGLGEGDGE